MHQPLTENQLTSFRTNGYLHIPGLIPDRELEAVQRDTGNMIQKGVDTEVDDPTYCYGKDAKDDDRRCLFRINGLISHHGHESFKLLLAYPPLLGAISQAVNHAPFVSSVHSCVFKIPHRGYPVPWHQDPVPIYHFPIFNVDIYLDEANSGNGGLYVLPGSHLGGYHGNPQFIRAWSKGKEDDAPGAIPVHTQPGDVLFHATSLIHGSFWNRSDSLRRTIYYHINHLDDITKRPEDDGHRKSFLPMMNLMQNAIETRKQRYPDEPPFPFKYIESLPEDS